MAEEDLQTLLRNVRAIALDVDGVLTDGGFWWSSSGEELKRFCFADIMGISLARRTGLKIGLISGESSPLIDRYAAKLKIEFVASGRRDKRTALKEFAAAVDTDLTQVCYIGDDVNDVGPMLMAGLSAAPKDAAHAVITRAKMVLRHSGGNGAVRELVDAILTAQGLDTYEVFSLR